MAPTPKMNELFVDRPGWREARRTGWRWVLHWGPNETRLMFPPRPVPSWDALTAAINDLSVRLGAALVPAFENMAQAMRTLTASGKVTDLPP